MLKEEIPARDDFKALLAIYINERKSLVKNCINISHEWLISVVNGHIREIEKFTTFEQIDNDLREHLRMSFDEWYETL
jgi:hypothetical protein